MVIHGCHQFFLKLPKPEHARMLAFQPDALSVPVVLGYPYPSSATESVRPLAMGWPRLKVFSAYDIVSLPLLHSINYTPDIPKYVGHTETRAVSEGFLLVILKFSPSVPEMWRKAPE
jgi:hypothetical protein